ncbi:hypothetical protein GPECTOR_3g318 [Gonium pectorale]|uniref:E2F-associated phosphoprotein n=1 Tax=Gonium pectorale TaxID=33097 RepID=A0A150GZA5_GONPE|nr:hypothetical protein GPECTOR_3g318 [Gonium pectorale]|eukprot:KXZ55171.1 hypothetical protein GPECTOR_3g318 [Gonium pectorale]
MGESGSGDDSDGEDAPRQEPDPLYDETADDKDAAWVERQRQGRISDAVLSCPGCFTTLSIDCQRHEKYHNQFRAMFVMNCKVEEDGGEGGAGGAEFDPSGGSSGPAGGAHGGRRPKRAKPSAKYRRVLCGVCDTEVGAYEVDEELYHFYHVFPSNA